MNSYVIFEADSSISSNAVYLASPISSKTCAHTVYNPIVVCWIIFTGKIDPFMEKHNSCWVTVAATVCTSTNHTWLGCCYGC